MRLPVKTFSIIQITQRVIGTSHYIKECRRTGYQQQGFSRRIQPYFTHVIVVINAKGGQRLPGHPVIRFHQGRHLQMDQRVCQITLQGQRVADLNLPGALIRIILDGFIQISDRHIIFLLASIINRHQPVDDIRLRIELQRFGKGRVTVFTHVLHRFAVKRPGNGVLFIQLRRFVKCAGSRLPFTDLAQLLPQIDVALRAFPQRVRSGDRLL